MTNTPTYLLKAFVDVCSDGRETGKQKKSSEKKDYLTTQLYLFYIEKQPHGGILIILL